MRFFICDLYAEQNLRQNNEKECGKRLQRQGGGISSRIQGGRSTVDQISGITQVVEKKMAYGQELRLLYVDLQKTYDCSVPLNLL